MLVSYLLSFLRSSHPIFVFLFISWPISTSHSILLVHLINVAFVVSFPIDGSEMFIRVEDHNETLHFFTDRVAGAILNPKELPMVSDWLRMNFSLLHK